MKFTYSPDARPVDGYTIRRGIHRGGFGEVYYAVSDAGKEVALKLLTHDLDTELRGIRQCLNLKHPNLVTIFDVRSDSEGDTWVVMEYIHGASLEDVLRAFPLGLPLDEVRDWMSGIFSGVSYLHERGLVHRDLKPANIYRENGVVKIGDVGLSKQMGGTRRQHTEAVGTVYYMAPEVAKGQYGPEVDVYGLGVMLYEMVTGRLPFDGETTAEILMKHLSSVPDWSVLPAHLRPVVAHALEKDPAKRIRTVRQFQEEFQQATRAEPLPESAFQPPPLRSNGVAGAATASTGGQRYTANGQKTPDFQSKPRHGCQWNMPWDHGKKRCGSIVSEVLESVVPDVRDRVRRKVERELRRHERRTAAKQSKPKRERSSRGRHSWWPWLALMFLVFVPWSEMSWGQVATVSCFALAGGAFLAVRTVRASKSPTDSTVAPAATSTPHQPAQPPPTRLEVASQSGLLAVVSASLLTIVGMVTWSQFEPALSRLQTNDLLWLSLASSLAVSAVVLAQQLTTVWRGHGLPLGWIVAALALAVGVAVGALDEFLGVQGTVEGPARPVFRHLGPHDLVADGQPTMAAYMLFFVTTLCLQNWNKTLDRFRDYRLRVGPLFWAALIGFLTSLFAGIPSQYAVLWSVVVTTAAQLAAPWEPGGKERRVPVEAA